METGPAEQVSAHTDDGVSGRVQANVALESGPIRLCAAPAATSGSSAIVGAALPGRYTSDPGLRHVYKYEKSPCKSPKAHSERARSSYNRNTAVAAVAAANGSQHCQQTPYLHTLPVKEKNMNM